MMRIDWRALATAPAFVPLLVSLLLILNDTGGDRLFGFLFFFALGCIVSYAATLGLLLPALFLLAIVARPLTARLAAGLGLLLGTLLWLPLSWVFWRASGPDSGPPSAAFSTYLADSMGDPLLLAFPLGGLVTTLLYRTLARMGSASEASR